MRRFLNDALITDVSLVTKLRTYRNAEGHFNIFESRRTHGFAFFTEGEIDFLYEGEKPFDVKANTFVYLPQGVAYKTFPRVEGKAILINFSTSVDMTDSAFGCSLSNGAQIQGLFMSALKCFRQKKVGMSAELKSIVYMIISLVQAASTHGFLPYEHYRKLEPAISHINENFLSGEVKISELAALCGMSRKYFTKLFTMYYETTPKQYLLDCQIDYARRLLLSDGDNNSVTEIAEKSGFNNIYYFSKMFKQRVGVTPSEYKRNG